MYHGKTIGVVIPAHNEEQSIALVVRELLATGLTDKIVVCDNASTDTTATAARHCGQRGREGLRRRLSQGHG